MARHGSAWHGKARRGEAWHGRAWLGLAREVSNKQRAKTMDKKNAHIFPVDVKELFKGQYISPEEIEKIYSKKRSDPNFGICILQLRQFIENSSDFLCKGEKQGLRIMEDAEADDVLWARHMRHVYGLRKTVNDGNKIDPSNFTLERVRTFENRQKCKQNVFVSAMNTLRDEMRERKLFGPSQIEMLEDGEK